MSAQAEQQKESDTIANDIWRVHAALDAVYGKGWAKNNPDTVAQFMQAIATGNLAKDVAGLREVIATGTGAITVGLERT